MFLLVDTADSIVQVITSPLMNKGIEVGTETAIRIIRFPVSEKEC